MEKCKMRLSRSFSLMGQKSLSDMGQAEPGPGWRFWRRLSTRSRHEHKANPLRKARPEIVLIEKAGGGMGSEDCPETASHVTAGGALSSTLPDVVDKAPILPRFNNNAVPPPKPPRLFLFRTPSTSSNTHSTEQQDAEDDSIYMNCERVTELKSQLQGLYTDSSRTQGRDDKPAGDDDVRNLGTSVAGEKNNNQTSLTLTGPGKEERGANGLCRARSDVNGRGTTATAAAIAAGVKPVPDVSNTPNAVVGVNGSSCSNNSPRHIPAPIQEQPAPQKHKIVTPELRTKRPGRSRRRSNEKGEVSRQRHIMNNVAELLRQRLDPYPLLDALKQAGVLNNLDIQAYLAHRDRKSVCEGLADLVGDAGPEILPVFYDVLASSGTCTEILEVLQVMRELDRLIHDIPHSCSVETSVLEDEKNLNFDVGYLAPDLSLKPLVELERVRASADKRLSKASSRASAYSLLEAAEPVGGAHCEVGVYPGLVMVSLSVTGHVLAGRRADALATTIRTHNCVCELHLGKTQLCGRDVQVLAKALEENKTVHSLDLRLNSLDAEGARGIAQLLQCTKTLRFLNLSSTGLNASGLKAIAVAASSNRSLHDLDLSFLDITDESCENIRDLLRSGSGLQKLRLRNNNLTWSGAYVLAEGVARNRSLSVLDLSRNNIGDVGLQALTQAVPDSCVSELCLENCGLTSAGGDSLSELVTHSKKLKQLDLSTNLLTDSGIFKLAPALEHTSSLQNLGLNMCGVTNDGFSKLMDVLEKNTSIIHMKLCYNKLGKEYTNPGATSDNLRYRLRIVTSSKPKLKILLWGNSFDET